MKKIFVLTLSLIIGAGFSSARIRIGANAGDMEKYAASELQRYIYQLTGTKHAVTDSGNDASFILETSGNDSNAQGYSISTVTENGKQVTRITGDSPVGLLYGVYGLLEDHMGMRFYMSGDVYPENGRTASVPEVNERKEPEMYIRGILPWTNFPQSATVYSYEDWKFIIDQCARMRMNFIMYHNYNGTCGHNEMFQNFEYRGFLSRNWMPTVKSGHGWQCPGWDINDYQFGASEIYDDYDFGADYGMHNETLSNRQIADKGSSMFRKIIRYAHTRGVKIGLGLDIDLIPQDYKAYGADAADPEVVKAQVRNVAGQYGELDYVLCFQSESPKDPVFYARWREIFDIFYDEMKRLSPDTRIAVSGWGLTAESVKTLPEDVICAPIAPYTASCETGEIYGEREYWGCPWLERDFNSSEYYYPFNIHLSETIDSYRNRAGNMKGFYTLTWRLTDAVSPKLWYVSKAPWYGDTELDSSRKVYLDFAEKNYGKSSAEAVIDIIDENEACSSNFGECKGTPPFEYNASNHYIMNIRSMSIDGNSPVTVAAEDFSEVKGAKVCDSEDYGKCIGYITRGCTLKYSGMDFNDAKKLSIRLSSASAGGKVSAFIDSMESEPVGSIETTGTGGWAAWIDGGIDVSGIEGVHDVYLCFSVIDDSYKWIGLAGEQLETVETVIGENDSDEQRYRLGHLKQRLSASLDHLILNRDFKNYTWEDFPGRLEPWAKSFLYRIDDISSKGNIMSTQNRFVQLNYIRRINDIVATQEVKSPTFIYARGLENGAIITWRNNEPSAASFRIYRNGKLAGTVLSDKNSFTDIWDGHAEYRVSAVSSDGKESPMSIPSSCEAGNADCEAPVIICVSPLSPQIPFSRTSLPIGCTHTLRPRTRSRRPRPNGRR